jgi:hypothetical protein
MRDDETLSTLVRVSRHYGVRERRLVCAKCFGEVKLTGGAYVCQTEGCGATYNALAQLAAVDPEQPTGRAVSA